MAKTQKPAEETEQSPVLNVQDFVETTKPQKHATLRRGEVLIVESDDNGKELNQFVSNQKTFDDFYSKNPKFSIKKK